MKTSEETLQREIETAQNPEQFDIENVEDGETAVEFVSSISDCSILILEDLLAYSTVLRSVIVITVYCSLSLFHRFSNIC